jgi:outer membrane protein
MNKPARLSLLAGALAAAFASGSQAADEGKWLVRARAVHLDFANKSDAIPLLAVPPDAFRVRDKTIPELDITYFFTRNIAAELLLSTAQKFDVTVSASALGAFDAGTFKALPPTLTLQYHFLPEGRFRPYLGAGINYTRISSVNLQVPGVTRLDLENDSWGGALQAGIDFKLDKNLFLNLDMKKIYIRSDVFAGGAKVSSAKLDPLAVGVGLGWRF